VIGSRPERGRAVLRGVSRSASPYQRFLQAPARSLLAGLALAACGENAPDVMAIARAAASAQAPTSRQIEDALQRGVVALVERQESYAAPGEAWSPEKREWPYEGNIRVEGSIPIGYRVGGTAIVATALIEASRGEPGPQARAAIARALDFVLERLRDPLMDAQFVGDQDVRGWGQAYAAGFLLRLRSADLVPAQRATEVEAAIDALVSLLAATEIEGRGGWNYIRGSGAASPASTFMTAATLQFLFEARRQGENVDAQVVERALQTLEAARIGTGAFQYSSEPSLRTGEGGEAVPGAIARMAACEVTLHLAGRGSLDRLRAAVDAFFEHWSWLEARRRRDGSHEPPYAIAPYYFYFGHRHAAQAIEFLPEDERGPRRARLTALLWHVREQGGGWNDRVFPRSEAYGTAMALLALCEPSLPRPAGWPAPLGTGY